ncbi:uncharacterized protein LOC141692406 isoform X1 [Apium graveolens]|uniref:uncharacterized protein LOC141692406 isoform X1 n=1 Tax=Apium graveolens TaxID=4045 RepID=UPI003D7A7E45
MQTYVRRKSRDKRVIEFDHFIQPNSHHHQQESAGSIEKSSTLIGFSPDEKIDTEADELDLPLAQWTQSQNKRRVVSSETTTLKVSSNAKLKPVESWSKSNVDAQNGDVCLTPGSVVWAKKASQMWWPAKVLIVKVLALDSGIEDTGGLFRVHYYGSEKSDWVDPARDLSPFEECFEERSCNPSEEFQEALKQAIHQKEHQSLSRKLFVPDKGHVCLNSTNSSETEHDCLVKGRSKRRRKPKVHFDELNVPSKSVKDSRRLRIMRSLGLAPPIGSPFAQSPMQ